MVEQISLDLILPNPEQPRSEFDLMSLADLAASIRTHGVIQPITVEPAADGYFILTDGERRVRAARMAKLTAIPAFIDQGRNGDGGQVRLERALVANIQRENMNPIDEARAFGRLRDKFGLTYKQIAERIGKPGDAGIVYVSMRIIWLDLEPEIQDLVARGELGKDARIARALRRLPDADTRIQMAQQFVKKKYSIIGCEKAVDRWLDATENYAPAIAAGPPSMQLAAQRAHGRPKKGPGWNALQQVGAVPAWSKIEKAAAGTCQVCGLADIASPTVCGECGVVEFLRRMMDLREP